MVRTSASSRLFALLLVLGALLTVAPGLGSASHGTNGTPVVTRLTLPTSDILFDPVSNKLYASVPARAGLLGNQVVAIDPATGAVGPSVFVGSEPGKLALSADGQFLYVALNGAAAVRRVQLPSLTAGLQFSLGADPFFGPYLVEDMEVLSSDPGAVAVSRRNTGVSPRHAGVAIYDEGVKLPDETARHTGSNVIEFGSSATRLYGYNNETTEFGFRRMTVGSSGVSTLDVATSLLTGFATDIEFDGGRVYATNGQVIDPEARTLLGSFPLSSAGPVEPDSAHGKVYFVSAGRLSEFDQATFTPLQSFPIGGMTGAPSSLVNIGRSDLAFRTNADQVFLVHFRPGPDATPPSISVPGDLTVAATSPAGAVVTYSASAVDDVDGSVPVACAPSSGAVFGIGTSTVVCTATDAAGNSSAKSFKVTVASQPPVVTRLTLPTSDILFDPVSSKLYASVPARAGLLGNHVVAIDPATGAVGPSVFVGSEPGKLALSADGQFLYVALSGAAAVRRVQLPSLTAGLQFSLGADPFFGPYLVADMEVLSSDPGAVAVSRRNAGFGHEGVAIYDEGVKLPEETARHTGSNVIEFGSSATRLYGYNNETSEGGFRRMTVGSSGVSTLDVTSVLTGFAADIEFDGGRVYATNGQVIDPEARTLLGSFPLSSAGPVEPDSAHGKVYFVSSGTLSEFDQATFTLRQSFPIGGMAGAPSSLVNIGRSDLAFRTNADQVFLVHFPDATPPSISVPGDLRVEATSPAGAVVTYSVTATDDTDPSPTVTCSPPSGSVFPLGTTTVQCTATDAAGNNASASFQVTVVDTTPPLLTVPGDITANATSPAGSEVVFEVTATDIVEGTFPAACTPPSGSTFPIGTTPVACTATDSQGNSASASFTVHAKGAIEQLDDLLDLVVTEGLGPGKSLAKKLEAARASLSAGNNLAACHKLGAFINEAQAQSGKALTPEQARKLVAVANRIRAVLDC